MNETDLVDDMVALVKKTRFTLDMEDGTAFTFGYHTHANGTPAIGEGSDHDATIVGISTPYMVKMLRFATDYVLHIDTTYNLDQSGYPTFGDFSACIALRSLFDKYKEITGKYPNIHFCMGDADKAQYNAVMNIASTKRQTKGMVKYLMCFFHVVKNIAEKV
ncbi:Hypothetical protein PHPALM_5650 [Phytophthora palmivora]|uniref:MULE transposase domain-containing protein n=1 Tax=Phytophthora palmivora TaxID=4796 RepID=A0A2P4YGU9_9STRA|nr:Hypothetical protein PHPALM_5650 [Phytophthora palmivora]